MKNTISKRRFFNIFQYDLEEDYLREMHNKGYKFEQIEGCCNYVFSEVEPSDYIYKLDFSHNFKNNVDKDDYMQIYSDTGWNYLGEYFDYAYFNKEGNDTSNEDIFSDNTSKLEMITRIAKARAFPLLIVFIIALAPESIGSSIGYIDPNSFLAGFLDGFSTVVTIGLATLLIYYFSSYLRLKKRIGNDNSI